MGCRLASTSGASAALAFENIRTRSLTDPRGDAPPPPPTAPPERDESEPRWSGLLMPPLIDPEGDRKEERQQLPCRDDETEPRRPDSASSSAVSRAVRPARAE